MKNLIYIGNLLSGKGKTITTIEELGKRLEAEGYNLVYASSVNNKLLRMFDMVVVFFKNFKKTDLVLIDTYSTVNFYYAVVIAGLCRFFNIKYLPILHGGSLENRLKNSNGLSHRLFDNAFCNVAPSGFLLSVFNSYGYKNVEYIPNSIKIKNYPFKHRKVVECKLLWVRSFAALYNPLMALEVVKELISRGFAVELCMVGPDKDGSLEICKSFADRYTLPVTFTGLLPKEDWIMRSSDYDIFINTTTVDNTPVSILEAMALGLPVVSTNVGGIPFLIENGKTGLLVDSRDVLKMADEIEKLLFSEELISDICKNAREYVEQMDWDVVKLKWNSILQNI